VANYEQDAFDVRSPDLILPAKKIWPFYRLKDFSCQKSKTEIKSVQTSDRPWFGLYLWVFPLRTALVCPLYDVRGRRSLYTGISEKEIPKRDKKIIIKKLLILNAQLIFLIVAFLVIFTAAGGLLIKGIPDTPADPGMIPAPFDLVIVATFHALVLAWII
jgi:hypothetical protein